MTKIKTVLGFIWAVAVVILIPAGFMSSESLAKKMVHASGMKISPMYTGGEVAKTIENKDYTTIIHKPVFACLIGESQKGFVQVVWRAKGALPAMIEEKIDIDGDEKPDFTLKFDTAAKTASFDPQNGVATKIIKIYNLKAGAAVRVGLKKQSGI
ncbi:MAG: hypothetical protein ACD_47C00193G0005 [uncultured bacterium]|nr:MAG: hypothetical protein ACD_47C00193G0005 [uncultured bacterium]HBC76240.1 hypothetical protein [Candidatus Wallbacteria bacterium]